MPRNWLLLFSLTQYYVLTTK